MMWHERPENAGKVGRLKKMYRNTKNDEIMLKLDISFSTLHRTARALGLVKTKRFMRRCQRAAAARARESHIIHGTYPPKGYIIPGSERYRFKAGETPLQRLGARKERRRVEKSAETRRQTLREERARRLFGVPQRTRLRVLNRGRRFYQNTWYLRSRGYEVDVRNLVAYYDDGTRRCPVLEKMGRNPDKGHYFDFEAKC
nr:MAG TPA: hypothetical protein [Caudoviricetes sp.]